jgi:hypothetical protein
VRGWCRYWRLTNFLTERIRRLIKSHDSAFKIWWGSNFHGYFETKVVSLANEQIQMNTQKTRIKIASQIAPLECSEARSHPLTKSRNVH